MDAVYSDSYYFSFGFLGWVFCNIVYSNFSTS